MINISTAILVQNKEYLKHHLDRYLAAGLHSIDIDIQESPFVSDATVNIDDAIATVRAASLTPDTSLGWDLKLAEPEAAVRQLLELSKELNQQFRIYIYTRANLGFLDSIDTTTQHVGLGLLGNESLAALPVYQRFPEIQIMSIDSEDQGSKLDADNLLRVTELKQMGYTGQVAIDGGVNLESAELIKQYPIDRVSVGSYFQKSEDVGESYRLLDGKLNG